MIKIIRNYTRVLTVINTHARFRDKMYNVVLVEKAQEV